MSKSIEELRAEAHEASKAEKAVAEPKAEWPEPVKTRLVFVGTPTGPLCPARYCQQSNGWRGGRDR